MTFKKYLQYYAKESRAVPQFPPQKTGYIQKRSGETLSAPVPALLTAYP